LNIPLTPLGLLDQELFYVFFLNFYFTFELSSQLE
jgi:hypothetical protein